MLTPDEQFAADILQALDMRGNPMPPPVVNEIGRHEVGWTEQQYKMVEALLGWLERWEGNPRQDRLRAKDDPLWQAVAVLCQHLASSRMLLRQKMEEMDEAAEQAWRSLW